MDQNNRTILLKKSLLEFYSKKDNMETIVSIMNKKISFSLRLLEWFCSNYSKKYNIVYNISKYKEFNVYLSYKSQLDSYQKKQFDPFKRTHAGYGKFEVEYDKGKSFTTTVGQLNFFKWCIENKILDYVKDNINVIKEDMASLTDIKKETSKEKKERKKRQALSSSATRTCVKRYTNIIIKF
jgi:hypothetical protein